MVLPLPLRNPYNQTGSGGQEAFRHVLPVTPVWKPGGMQAALPVPGLCAAFALAPDGSRFHPIPAHADEPDAEACLFHMACACGICP